MIWSGKKVKESNDFFYINCTRFLRKFFFNVRSSMKIKEFDENQNTNEPF